jgi:hypothetical protein
MKIKEIYGELVVIGSLKKSRRTSGNYKYSVRCLCSCGVFKDVEIASLRRGQVTCGCRRKRTGKNNPGWKGGKTLHKAGYVVINGTKTNGKYPARKFEHHLVMETLLGRKLTAEETVHHKNGVRDDNRPKNLELWCSRHPSGQRVSDLVKWAREILKKYA